ncbi:MAG: hypothetical protein ABI333_29415 [bacterium]
MRTRILAGMVCLASVVAINGAVAQAQENRGAAASLFWMGARTDKVQQGKAVRPDGKPDGRFRLVLQSDKARRVVHMLLRSCDARGVLTGRAAWDTDRTRLWVLGVYKNNQALPTGKGRATDRVNKGKTVYDLYASKPLGGFTPGLSFCAYVTFGDGMGVSARAPVTEPVRAGLSYSGKDKDRVGRAMRANPDGVPDAHFVLRMDSGSRTAELRGVTVTMIDAADRPLPGQVWDTIKNRHWIVGVERGQKRLNRQDRAIRDEFKGMAEYHLFLTPKKALRGGDRFKVVARFSTGGPAVAVVSLPHTQTATASLQYVGLTEDKLGARSPSGPDGKPDGHFRLSLKATGRKITGIVLRAVWPGGAAVQGQIWDTRPRGYRMIAVYRNGKLLNKNDKGLKERVADAASYDLYIHNTGWVRPLQAFQAEVIFQGGDRIFAKAKVLQPRISGPVTAAFAYHGFVADRVGVGGSGRKDGKTDAKFTLDVDTGGRALQVSKLEISVSDAQGNTWRKTWDTQPGGNWILGAERGGKRLNPKDRAIADDIHGKVSYTLWISKDTYTFQGRTYSFFTKGGYFTVRVFFKSHPTIIKTIRLNR